MATYTALHTHCYNIGNAGLLHWRFAIAVFSIFTLGVNFLHHACKNCVMQVQAYMMMVLFPNETAGFKIQNAGKRPKFQNYGTQNSRKMHVKSTFRPSSITSITLETPMNKGL